MCAPSALATASLVGCNKSSNGSCMLVVNEVTQEQQWVLVAGDNGLSRSSSGTASGQCFKLFD